MRSSQNKQKANNNILRLAPYNLKLYATSQLNLFLKPSDLSIK